MKYNFCLVIYKNIDDKKQSVRIISENKLNIREILKLLNNFISFNMLGFTEKFLGKYYYTIEIENLTLLNESSFEYVVKNEELFNKYFLKSNGQVILDLTNSNKEYKIIPLIIKCYKNKELICNIKNREIEFEYMEE